MSLHPHTLLIGSHSGEHVSIELSDASKESWRGALVDVVNQPFSGSFRFYVHNDDLVSFRDELRILNATLGGEARFATIEANIDLTLAVSRLGEIKMVGSIVPDTGRESRLHVEICLDQTFLAAPLAALEALQLPEREKSSSNGPSGQKG